MAIRQDGVELFPQQGQGLEFMAADGQRQRHQRRVHASGSQFFEQERSDLFHHINEVIGRAKEVTAAD